MDHRAMAVAGFVAPWSARPGETVGVHLSAREPIASVRVRRLDRDGTPAVAWPVEVRAPVAVGQISLGSWVSVPLPAGDLVLDCEFRLTRNPDPRPLFALGGLVLEVSDIEGPRFAGMARPGPALPRDRWLRLRLEFQARRVRANITDQEQTMVALETDEGVRPSWLEIGGEATEAQPTLNVRLGRIAVESAVGRTEWRFPARGPVALVPALGGGLPILVRNLPSFASPSPRWNGSSFDPRLTPDHYDAIHLHDDDFGGLEWPATHAIAIPKDAETGVYAVEVGDERLPFFIRPAAASARLAFLAPTATYLAYADEALPRDRFPWVCHDRGHAFAQANGLTSPYDVHADGSGVCLTTLRRPRSTIRDDYLYPLCGAPHLLPVDLRLLRFAAREGIDLDVITDHDLDAEGAALIADYAGIVTGSHPEYWSEPMLRALEGFLDAGGGLAYLGGNGFDTVVAFDGDVMELRRASIPSHRTWDPGIGEASLSISGEPGGPWRQRGRGEFHLTGVGMSLMGFGRSRPFGRTDASRSEDFAWVFDGVDTDEFGGSGVVLGGAAGYEVDGTNRRLGTPEGVRVLAMSEGFGPEFIDDAGRWFPEESERVLHRRAEMTLRRHPGGGIVFSASSVAWCGALPGDGETNDVGRITRNVLAALMRPLVGR